MAPYHQIKKLKNQNENLSRDLNYALEDLDDANREIRTLECQIRLLQIQLNESQKETAEKKLLLREKDEKLAEYLAQINEMDNVLISDQDSSKKTACPLCFKDMTNESSDKSTWFEVEPCGHRTCWECFNKFNQERKKSLSGISRIFSEDLCGICGEPAKNTLLDDGVTRPSFPIWKIKIPNNQQQFITKNHVPVIWHINP